MKKVSTKEFNVAMAAKYPALQILGNLIDYLDGHICYQRADAALVAMAPETTQGTCCSGYGEQASVMFFDSDWGVLPLELRTDIEDHGSYNPGIHSSVRIADQSFEPGDSPTDGESVADALRRLDDPDTVVYVMVFDEQSGGEGSGSGATLYGPPKTPFSELLAEREKSAEGEIEKATGESLVFNGPEDPSAATAVACALVMQASAWRETSPCLRTNPQLRNAAGDGPVADEDEQLWSAAVKDLAGWELCQDFEALEDLRNRAWESATYYIAWWRSNERRNPNQANLDNDRAAWKWAFAEAVVATLGDPWSELGTWEMPRIDFTELAHKCRVARGREANDPPSYLWIHEQRDLAERTMIARRS